jgi:threonine dehydratase
MTYLALDEIEQARARIHPHLTPTPLIALDLPETGRRISVKPEYLQPTGSFKIRGASNCVARLTDEQKQRGVIAYSTGNHAQAVAMAARAAGIPATIVMSPDVPQHKLERTRTLGARLMMAEPTSEARRKLAEQYACYEGLALIPPYDDLTVMAGQGTIGLEILDEVIPATVYVPVGGGGLIAGIAAAIKQREPFVRVVGVEPVEENDTFRSWTIGRRVSLAGPSGSIADAIKVQIPGEKTFPLMQRYVDDIVLVEDGQIVDAMRLYFRQTGHRLEPAGAAALAASLDSKTSADAAGPVVCIGTGQNVTGERFSELTGI